MYCYNNFRTSRFTLGGEALLKSFKSSAVGEDKVKVSFANEFAVSPSSEGCTLVRSLRPL